MKITLLDSYPCMCVGMRVCVLPALFAQVLVPLADTLHRTSLIAYN